MSPKGLGSVIIPGVFLCPRRGLLIPPGLCEDPTHENQRGSHVPVIQVSSRHGPPPSKEAETKSQLPELSAEGTEPSQAMLIRKEDVTITIRQQTVACTHKQAVGLSTVFLSASNSFPNTTSWSTAVGSRL